MATTTERGDILKNFQEDRRGGDRKAKNQVFD